MDVGCYTDGLVHVSRIANERVENVEDGMSAVESAAKWLRWLGRRQDYVQEDQEVTVWARGLTPPGAFPEVISKDLEQNRLGLTMVAPRLKISHADFLRGGHRWSV